MKQCCRCKEWKERDQFYADKRKQDGLYCCCKSCHSKRTHELNIDINHDEFLARRKVYRDNHKEKISGYDRKWVAKNKEHRNAKAREWNHNNPEKVHEINKRNRKKLVDKIPVYRATRLARERGAGGNVTPAQWEELKQQYNYQCVYCNAKLDRPSMDHIVPVSKGGKHIIENIVPVCTSCNSSKKDKSVLVFLAQRKDDFVNT